MIALIDTSQCAGKDLGGSHRLSWLWLHFQAKQSRCAGSCTFPEGPSTQDFRFRIQQTNKGMVLGARNFKYCVGGPSGLDKSRASAPSHQRPCWPGWGLGALKQNHVY